MRKKRVQNVNSVFCYANNSNNCEMTFFSFVHCWIKLNWKAAVSSSTPSLFAFVHVIFSIFVHFQRNFNIQTNIMYIEWEYVNYVVCTVPYTRLSGYFSISVQMIAFFIDFFSNFLFFPFFFLQLANGMVIHWKYREYHD